MFRIEFFVDDKNLGEAFKRLAGIAKNVQHVYVPNVEGRPNGKVHMAAGDSQEMFVKEMRKRHWTEVDAAKARKLVADMGFSPTSYSYLLQGLVKSGAMTSKKIGKGIGKLYTLKAEK